MVCRHYPFCRIVTARHGFPLPPLQWYPTLDKIKWSSPCSSIILSFPHLIRCVHCVDLACVLFLHLFLNMSAKSRDQLGLKAHWKCVVACILVSMSSFQYGLDYALISGFQAMIPFLQVSKTHQTKGVPWQPHELIICRFLDTQTPCLPLALTSLQKFSSLFHLS